MMTGRSIELTRLGTQRLHKSTDEESNFIAIFTQPTPNPLTSLLDIERGHGMLRKKSARLLLLRPVCWFRGLDSRVRRVGRRDWNSGRTYDEAECRELKTMDALFVAHEIRHIKMFT